MAVKIAPDGRQQFFNSQGGVLAGGLLFTYTGGTTTKRFTYTDSTGNTQNANPIVLDSAGRTPSGVWLTDQIAYKFVLSPANDTDPPTSPLWTEDNIYGINATTSANTLSEWVDLGYTETRLSATQFSTPTDVTADFDLGRRVKCIDGASTFYGYVSAASFGAGITTVTVVLDSGALTASLSNVFVSVLNADNSAVPWVKSSTVGLTMLGTLTLSGKPTSANMAATKQFSEESGARMQNGKITSSAAAGALTINLKTTAGADPSSSDPVRIKFIALGVEDVETITAAMSITIPSGATLATESGLPCRIWLSAVRVAAGNVQLAVSKAVAASTFTYPYRIQKQAEDRACGVSTLNAGSSVASTLYSAAGTAGIAHTYIAALEITPVTAGTWIAPDLTIVNPPFRPGDIQEAWVQDAAVSTYSTIIPEDDTIPTNTEGDAQATLAISPPGGTCDVVDVQVHLQVACTVATRVTVSLLTTAAGTCVAVGSAHLATVNQTFQLGVATRGLIFTLTSPSIRIGPAAAATITLNGVAAARRYGGTSNSYMKTTVYKA